MRTQELPLNQPLFKTLETTSLVPLVSELVTNAIDQDGVSTTHKQGISLMARYMIFMLKIRVFFRELRA